LLRKAEESDDVRSRSHAYGRDKIDLTSLANMIRRGRRRTLIPS
jgi:hypothetical protein